MKPSNCDVQYIDNGLNYKIADVLWEYDTMDIEDAVITVFDHAPDVEQYNLDVDQIYFKDNTKDPSEYIKDTLKPLDIGKVDAEKVEKRMQDLRFFTLHNIKLILVKFFVYLLVLLLIMYQSIFLFFYHHKLELSIRYLNGNGFIKRYRELFLINGFVYFTGAILTFIIFKISITALCTFIAACFIFDILISLIMISLFEKRSISSIMKGEE